ncbi:MAG TPA: hypothetical protein VFQ53_13670 [Kofleriaceae bacterium]|nr:hypothetical protein [Kofleriaceae bacterium]
MIAGDDPTPWNLLHDATIVGLERDVVDTVTVKIDVPYIRDRFADGGTLFAFALVDCRELTYTPLDEPTLRELSEIASSEPTIGEATVEDGAIVIAGTAGTLRVRYRELGLALDTGRPLALDELERAVRAYWDEWNARTSRDKP